jgi:ABC-type multidrug transport system ATPase subunit
MAESLLAVQSLVKRFGAVQASNNFSLEVARGELHALIGPNGAGKTTALNQLCGELMPDSGQIDFDGRRITRLPIHRRARSAGPVLPDHLGVRPSHGQRKPLAGRSRPTTATASVSGARPATIR